MANNVISWEGSLGYQIWAQRDSTLCVEALGLGWKDGNQDKHAF